MAPHPLKPQTPPSFFEFGIAAQDRDRLPEMATAFFPLNLSNCQGSDSFGLRKFLRLRSLGDGTGAIRTRDLPLRRRKSLYVKVLYSKTFKIAF
jgi:hypothetical protein